MWGNQVWIPDDDEAWEVGIVMQELEEEFVVVENDRKAQKSLKKSQIFLVDHTHLLDHDNICAMQMLHEAPLLHLLKSRYKSEKHYTFAADVLVSVNPYKPIISNYGAPIMYLDLSSTDQSEDHTVQLPPHAFAVANKALRSLVHNSDESFRENMMGVSAERTRINQSVIVSGESGAGKTEASKLIIEFLIQANGAMTVGDDDGSGSAVANLAAVGGQIKSILLESSVIYEAIGNAKTVRNDNSSRFGKYIKLQYTPDNRLLSAYTETFLLEQARLVSIGENERNFHVFYQLIRGLLESDVDLATCLSLHSVDDFHLLNQGNCTVITSENEDVEDFHALYHALQVLYTIYCIINTTLLNPPCPPLPGSGMLPRRDLVFVGAACRHSPHWQLVVPPKRSGRRTRSRGMHNSASGKLGFCVGHIERRLCTQSHISNHDRVQSLLGPLQSALPRDGQKQLFLFDQVDLSIYFLVAGAKSEHCVWKNRIHTQRGCCEVRWNIGHFWF